MKNVIIVNTHDTGVFISPYRKKLPTPNFESFSADSVVFDNCFCASPTCSPSRASMLTGTYNTTNGMIGLAHRNFKLTDFNQHLANILKANNYNTVLCGIQHENGFFENKDFFTLSEELGYIENITASLENYETDEEQLLWDDKNCDNVTDYLERYDFENKPLFLQYGMFATHRDYPRVDGAKDKGFSRPSLFENVETNDVDGLYKSLENADKNFGKVIDKLKAIGQYENSVIIYTTDHGLANPLSKCFLTDNGTHVALMMRVPGQEAYRYKNNFSHVSLVPTLLEALSIKHERVFHEKSQWQQIINNESIQNDILTMINVHTSYEPARAIRTDRYKLIKYYDTEYCYFNYSNIDKSEYKELFMNLPNEKEYNQLYDLYFDPLEQNNLFDDSNYQEVIKDLESKLILKMESINDEIPKLDKLVGVHKMNKRECVITGSKNPDDYM